MAEKYTVSGWIFIDPKADPEAFRRGTETGPDGALH